MKQKIDTIIPDLIGTLGSQWLRATKAEIENADGRKDRNDPICKTASCLYLAYSGDQILYVGETSKSIKWRFISDGSGSHKQACSNWYAKMTHVRFIIFEVSPHTDRYRKLLEQALSIHHEPMFYGNRIQQVEQMRTA